MRTLIYKRTHNGDPDQNGWFGVRDCMGSIRNRDFGAVIGVGGIGCEARASGIASRLNWIGIGAEKVAAPGNGAPLVKFKHFLDFGNSGKLFQDLAPKLAKRMYSRNIRHLMDDDLSEDERCEVDAIINLAKNAPPSLRQPARCIHGRQSPRHCGTP